MSPYTLILALIGSPIDDSRPTLGQLEDSFRHGPRIEANGNKVPGFVISSSAFSANWIIAHLQWTEIRGSHDFRRLPPNENGPTSAALAINTFNNQVKQLAPPFRAASRQKYNLSGLYFVAPGRCHASIQEVKIDADGNCHLVANYLWDWRVEEGTISPIGGWNETLWLSRLVDSSAMEVTLQPVDKRSSVAQLNDIRTRRRTEFILQKDATKFELNETFLSIGDLQTLLAVPDRLSMIVFNRDSKHSPHAFCADPNFPNGRRWLIDNEMLQKAVGSHPSMLIPASSVLPATHRFVAQLETLEFNGKKLTGNRGWLLHIDARTGAIVKIIPLPYSPTVVTISPDQKECAIVGGETGNDIRLVDADTGTTLIRGNLFDFGNVYPFAFEKRSQILGHDRNIIWRFTLRNSFKGERIFQLDPASKDE